MSLAWLTCAILTFRLGKPRPPTAKREPLENRTALLAHPLGVKSADRTTRGRNFPALEPPLWVAHSAKIHESFGS